MTWKWSYSRLFKYDSCPHAYYFRYVLGMPEKETEAMANGKQFHEVIASSVLRQPPPMGIPKDVQELALKAYRLLQTHIFKGEIVAVEREIITPITETDLFHVVIDRSITTWNRSVSVMGVMISRSTATISPLKMWVCNSRYAFNANSCTSFGIPIGGGCRKTEEAMTSWNCFPFAIASVSFSGIPNTYRK